MRQTMRFHGRKVQLAKTELDLDLDFEKLGDTTCREFELLWIPDAYTNYPQADFAVATVATVADIKSEVSPPSLMLGSSLHHCTSP